jgi:ABC-type branched-subunit amino acid transport system substrate-binding protein
VIASRTATLLLAFALTACGGSDAPAPTDEPADGPPVSKELQTDFGVDVPAKTLRLGVLNDESGPAAAIGKPYAIGKRILASQVNAGGSGLLPDGWTVELVERDHGYNPQQSVQAYKEIKDDVLFLATSFGTPNTLPLVPMLKTDGMLAFPASLSSQMAAEPHTPPAGPSYVVEAARAMDWAVQTAGASNVKAGIVYQKDDYGKDGLGGWKTQAALHGVEVVAEQTVAPGQKDMTAVIAALKDAGATHVLLTTLPSATGPLLGTAAQLQYGPTWIGNTPAWIDGFFSPDVIPSAVFGTYHQVYGLPYWGEDVPGMDTFLAAFEAHKPEGARPDFYTMMSYVQGAIALEGAKRAIDNGDITRGGFQDAIGGINGFTAGGLIQPLSYDSKPYVTGTKARLLKPDFDTKSWSDVSPYADALTTAATVKTAPTDAPAEGG